MKTMDYCPKCCRETLHVEIPHDMLFDFALECTECHIVWECIPPAEHDYKEVKEN